MGSDRKTEVMDIVRNVRTSIEKVFEDRAIEDPAAQFGTAIEIVKADVGALLDAMTGELLKIIDVAPADPPPAPAVDLGANLIVAMQNEMMQISMAATAGIQESIKQFSEKFSDSLRTPGK